MAVRTDTKNPINSPAPTVQDNDAEPSQSSIAATGSGKPTVKDVAKTAGVSLATVDRVLNKRKGVRAKTIAKVEAAIAELNFERDLDASLLARTRPIQLAFIAPANANPFMDRLRHLVQAELSTKSNTRINLHTIDVPPLDAEALVDAIDALDAKTTECAIIVAFDDDLVRRAVARAKTRAIPIVTLVSDLPESRRAAFVGIDNIAAGRTAASLMGRFLRKGEQVALIVGSLDLRDHRDRFIGFNDVMLEEYPHIELIGPTEGFDDVRETARRTNELLTDYPKLAGIYSIGAGNEGLFDTLASRLGPNRLRIIVHEMTDHSRAALTSGYCDIVLDQNPVAEARQAIDLARRLAINPDFSPHRDMARDAGEIRLFMRDNLLG